MYSWFIFHLYFVYISVIFHLYFIFISFIYHLYSIHLSLKLFLIFQILYAHIGQRVDEIRWQIDKWLQNELSPLCLNEEEKGHEDQTKENKKSFSFGVDNDALDIER